MGEQISPDWGALGRAWERALPTTSSRKKGLSPISHSFCPLPLSPACLAFSPAPTAPPSKCRPRTPSCGQMELPVPLTPEAG